jgi:predicted ArsR family transcriptional regulator
MNGVSPLAALRRDLAVMTRSVDPALEQLAKRDVHVSVTDLAAHLLIPVDDARTALQALEHSGLVTSTHYRVTTAGKTAART